MKWWHKWRERVWGIRYIEAIGRIDDLKDGPRSFAMKMAVHNRYAAEINLCHHLKAQGQSVPEVELPESQIARIRSHDGDGERS